MVVSKWLGTGHFKMLPAYQVIAYVIGAEQTDFKGDGAVSNDVFPDNGKSYHKTGMTGPTSKGEFRSIIEFRSGL